MAVETEARQHAHKLLDQLGPGQLEAVTRLLEALIAPEQKDEEELTEADRRAIAISREYFRNNPQGGISFEQVVAECGFTMDEIRNNRGAQ